MSAFVVSDKHISGLLSIAKSLPYMYRDVFGTVPDKVGDKERQQLGQVLLDENYRSVNYRYRETEGGHDYRYEFPGDLSGVQVLALCDCYEYQACETPDYHQSKAAEMIHHIRKFAIKRVPGYDKAAWSI